MGGAPAAWVEDAVHAAARASCELARIPADHRCRMLEDIATQLELAREELITTAIRETALTRARLEAELTRTTAQLRFFTEVIRDGAYLEVTIDEGHDAAPDLRRMMRPLGPVAVFAASNFPFAFSVAGGDTASAIAAGNPVVVKAHPGHPELSAMCAEIVQATLRSAGAPAGTFAMVCEFEAGPELVCHPLITAVAFTGSVQGGRALFDLAHSRPVPIPFFGELGSVNPVVVSPAAAATRSSDIAEGLVASFTASEGQLCTKPGVIFYPAESNLPDELVRRTSAVQTGPMLSPTIRATFATSVSLLGAVSGLRTLVEGSDGTPWLFATEAAAVIHDAYVVREECFGPAAVLVSYVNDTELLQAICQLEGSLAATIHAEPEEQKFSERVLEHLVPRCGRIVWNGWPTGVAVTWSTQHGGPYPSSTPPASTSVGAAAISRFLRPVAYQNMPEHLLPLELRSESSGLVPRRVNGRVEHLSQGRP